MAKRLVGGSCSSSRIAHAASAECSSSSRRVMEVAGRSGSSEINAISSPCSCGRRKSNAR